MYRKKLQVLLLAMATTPKYWVDIPPLIAREQVLADMYDSLGHCRRDKLLITLCGSYW